MVNNLLGANSFFDQRGLTALLWLLAVLMIWDWLRWHDEVRKGLWRPPRKPWRLVLGRDSFEFSYTQAVVDGFVGLVKMPDGAEKIALLACLLAPNVERTGLGF